MPELPEVETTLRGITPHIKGQTISKIIIRQRQLRWPIPDEIKSLTGLPVEEITRRGKYLFWQTPAGHLIWHLGMSGSMLILPIDDESESPRRQSHEFTKHEPEKHEHVVFEFNNGLSLRYRDPRRFGALLFTADDPNQHKLIRSLGPEPLQSEFNTDTLYQACRNRTAPIKHLIMDSHIVVGVGNIYACEALYLAGINPKRKAGKISKQRIEKLVSAIKTVLQAAINQGGTTLQDFNQADGKPGYFKQSLNVYGQRGRPCSICSSKIRQIKQAQRSTFYCANCQR